MGIGLFYLTSSTSTCRILSWKGNQIVLYRAHHAAKASLSDVADLVYRRSRRVRHLLPPFSSVRGLSLSLSLSLPLSAASTMKPESAAAEERILVEKKASGVAHVVINRPKSLNSLTRPMIIDLARTIKALDADQAVGVIVLSGAGRAFCSGVDLTAAEAVFKGDVKDPETDPVHQMEVCRKPIVGAVRGFAVTAGFEIALACDVLVAAPDAVFLDTHARFGIFPSWGLSQKLSRIIGPNRAREVSLTATPITAAAAEKWGLVSHVVDADKLLDKATEVAEAMLRNNRDLVLRYKSVINDGLKLDLGSALALEKERAHSFYEGMTKEQFEQMRNYISGRRSKPTSKM